MQQLNQQTTYLTSAFEHHAKTTQSHTFAALIRLSTTTHNLLTFNTSEISSNNSEKLSLLAEQARTSAYKGASYCTHPTHDVIGVSSFTSLKNQIIVSAVRREYGFSSLSEKTCLQMPCTFFSVIWRLWELVWSGFEPANSRSADSRSPNWANQAVVRREANSAYSHFYTNP